MPPTPRSPKNRKTTDRSFSFGVRLRRCLMFGGIGILIAVISALGINAVRLQAASAQPVDAFLVLGGSIQREIYVAELAKQYPETPILISQGSAEPCIWLIFERAGAPMQNVWLEKCADSTFENFYFSSPILREWHTRKVKLLTSETHLPRAVWLAQILLGAQGIWVELETVPEEGVPANQESWLKTSLDVTRSLLWAVASQAYRPQCSNVTQLTAVDLEDWQERGFRCEHQAGLEI